MQRDKQPPSDMDGALVVDADDRDDRDDRDEHAPAQRAAADGEPQEDGKGELSVEMVTEIVTRMGLQITVQLREDGEEVVVDLSGEDAGRVIGKKGQTLDALQFVINKIVNRFPDSRRHVVLDSGDYRQRREEGLSSMARREAKRAVVQGRIVTLEPMSPRDRRVIHLSLAKFPGVSTRSDGQGNERRVRIIPARMQGGRDRGGRDRDRGGDRGGDRDRGPDRGGDRDRGPDRGGDRGPDRNGPDRNGPDRVAADRDGVDRDRQPPRS